MANSNKIAWNTPLVLFTISHLVIIGATYGTITSEMGALTKSLADVVIEMKISNQSIQQIKEVNLRQELQIQYSQEKIQKLENKHE